MKGHDRERNLAKEAYYSDIYFSYGQLWSFVEQIRHIRLFDPESFLEVGIGNGLVSGFFRGMGIRVKTYDINPNLMADVTASVYVISDFVEPDEFDLIVCCEVLEHMPFEDFETTVGTFSRLSDQLFLTLPVHGKRIGFGGNVRLPKFRRWLGVWLRLPTGQGHLSDMHFWEVDYDHMTSSKKIVGLLGKYYEEIETGLFKANPYHRYFRCSKPKGVNPR